MNDIIRHFRKVALLRDGGGLTDRQLLEGFLSRRDEASFAALVRRHGPMVLAVCRRVLRQEQDAEDAYQATFIVLARRAGSLRSRELVGNWLHGVAYRTALRARTMNARRRAREQQARELARPDPATDDGWQELLPLLDRELDRLPERYRVAVVLCDLEGRTRREAARQLGVPEGTLSGRLTRAHRLLARRMARYGLAPMAGALAALLGRDAASAGVPRGLEAAAARAAALATGGQVLAAGAVPARVLALTEGVIKTMLLAKLKTFVAVAFVLFVSLGALGLTYRPGVAQSPPKPDRPMADELEELRLEVAALRKGLEATRQRVKALEAEAQARKVGAAAAPGGAGANHAQHLKLGEFVLENAQLKTYVQPKAIEGMVLRFDLRPDPLTEAEAALKKLRQNPNDKGAADALEGALKQMREREKAGAGKKP
jgi:RNA polymerase sigma factor (sigma-70 family)